jgi:hypothetical protein
MTSRQPGESTAAYVARLENEVSGLRTEVVVLKAKGGGWKTKKERIKEKNMSAEELHLSDAVLTLCQEYLFPRVKFLPNGWEIYDPTNTSNFAAMVKRNLKGKLRGGMKFAEQWPLIITDEIMSKYSVMRCNVNNHIRKAFLGKFGNVKR